VDILKKLIRLLIDRISQYSIASFYFWITMFRGGIIYGFVPSAVGLIQSVEAIHRNDDSSIRSFFQQSYQENRRNKGLSFCLFIFSGISMMSVNSRLQSVYSFLSLLQYPLLIWTGILWIFSIYSIYFLAIDKKKKHESKWIYALAFDTCIRHPFRSLVILITMAAFGLILKINLVVFIFLTPPLFIIAVKNVVYIPEMIEPRKKTS
jgi:uncharacterized membrane protein YesL